jgi:FixJ family two-component response regulator
LISIIDDDESTRLSLASLMRSFGLEAKTYDSAEDFLRSGAAEPSSCIITDIHMPGLSGIELKQWLDTGAGPGRIRPCCTGFDAGRTHRLDRA